MNQNDIATVPADTFEDVRAPVVRYVTFRSDGSLSGAYLQSLLPEHTGCYIEVSDDVASEWHFYRANAARDGVEEIPLATAPPPSIDDLAAQYMVSVQRMLDDAAQSYGYDSIANAVTYAEEPAVPRFQEEGRRLRAWRSLVWDACHAMLDQVKTGELPVPTEMQVLAALPVLDELRPLAP